MKELANERILRGSTMIPVFDMNSFGAAFNMAVQSIWLESKEQRFWWNGSVYTTERGHMPIQDQGKWLKTGN